MTWKVLNPTGDKAVKGALLRFMLISYLGGLCVKELVARNIYQTKMADY